MCSDDVPPFFLAMAGHVDHVSIGAPNKEAADAPRFIGDRMHDLVPASLCLCVRRADVVDLDGHDRVLRCGRVAGHDLDGRAGIRGGEPGHPSLVHPIFAEPKEFEELPSPFNVVGVQVGELSQENDPRDTGYMIS